jgi:hypothetical protein
LIDSTTEKTLDYEINGEIFTIETHGIMPKIDDFWRFARFKDGIVWKVWDDVCYIVGSYFGSLIKNPELYTSIRTLRDGNKLETPRDVYNHVYSCCMV